jgi:hypothetical protein
MKRFTTDQMYQVLIELLSQLLIRLPEWVEAIPLS